MDILNSNNKPAVSRYQRPVQAPASEGVRGDGHDDAPRDFVSIGTSKSGPVEPFWLYGRSVFQV